MPQFMDRFFPQGHIKLVHLFFGNPEIYWCHPLGETILFILKFRFFKTHSPGVAKHVSVQPRHDEFVDFLHVIIYTTQILAFVAFDISVVIYSAKQAAWIRNLRLRISNYQLLVARLFFDHCQNEILELLQSQPESSIILIFLLENKARLEIFEKAFTEVIDALEMQFLLFDDAVALTQPLVVLFFLIVSHCLLLFLQLVVLWLDLVLPDKRRSSLCSIFDDRPGTAQRNVMSLF